MTVSVSLKPSLAQTTPPSEVEDIRTEMQRMQTEYDARMKHLQERLNRIGQAQQPAETPLVAQAPPPAVPPPGEREISMEKEHPLQLVGLPKPEVEGVRISGFVVASFSYNSHIQMVPEFAGGVPALADSDSTNFRFDKFGLSLSKTFAPWLSASASIEVENHRDRHSHGFAPGFGCTGGGTCVEQFGTEEAETEVNLDKFHLTGIVPIGNGLALSIGRFDVPFGIERHDEPLLLTATTSEVFDFGRPERMTGFQTAYQFTPWLDATAWVVNRWENETVEEEADFNDNNKGKSFGGRIGFTPLPVEGLLNIGLGGWYGPEQDDENDHKRWLLDLDFTWTPIPRLLLAGEVIYGGEDSVSFRERGIPFAAPAVTDEDVNWWGFYLLAHYDIFDWLGFSFRYGYFDDLDGARTGVDQVLQSWTFAPIIHLSRLIPDLRPTGATYARTRHPIDWVDLKLEYRLNHSSESVFSDADPGTPILSADDTSHQFQLQLVVNF
jgi:hypothetical protein